MSAQNLCLGLWEAFEVLYPSFNQYQEPLKDLERRRACRSLHPVLKSQAVTAEGGGDAQQRCTSRCACQNKMYVRAWSKLPALGSPQQVWARAFPMAGAEAPNVSSAALIQSPSEEESSGLYARPQHTVTLSKILVRAGWEG